MLVALVVIRIGVKVLQVAYPDAAAPIAAHQALGLDGVAGHGAVGRRAAAAGAGRAGLNPLEGGGRGDAVGAHHHRRAVTAAAVLLIARISAAIESRLLRSATGAELSLRKAVSNAVRALLIFVGLHHGPVGRGH